jgi:hypothetical protein
MGRLRPEKGNDQPDVPTRLWAEAMATTSPAAGKGITPRTVVVGIDVLGGVGSGRMQEHETGQDLG